jgi:hypothetical protein
LEQKEHPHGNSLDANRFGEVTTYSKKRDRSRSHRGPVTKQDRDFRAEKADRALVLLEKGISSATIAERLCVRPVRVKGMIAQAKQRREKKVGELGKMMTSSVIFHAEQRADAKWHIVCHCPDGKIDHITGFLDEYSIKNWLASEHCDGWLTARGLSR